MRKSEAQRRAIKNELQLILEIILVILVQGVSLRQSWGMFPINQTIIYLNHSTLRNLFSHTSQPRYKEIAYINPIIFLPSTELISTKGKMLEKSQIYQIIKLV